MAVLKIGITDIAPIIPQAGHVQRVTQEDSRRQPSSVRLQPYRSYAPPREESITCRETTTGTYEAVLGADPVLREQSSRKGQIIDLWI